jgi:predicted nucleic acid-binding protein
MGVKELRQVLGDQKLLFVDTNIIIYLLDNHPRYGELAMAVLEAIEAGQAVAVTSVLTLAEVLTKPARVGNERAMQDYELYLTNFPNLKLVAVDQTVARTAARLRALYPLKMPDAIQLATAQLAVVDAIITNDKQWRGKTGSATLLVLDDYL